MSQFTSNMLAIYKFLAVAVLKFFRDPQFLGRIRNTSRIQEYVNSNRRKFVSDHRV